jgi:hypothetical protein
MMLAPFVSRVTAGSLASHHGERHDNFGERDPNG